MAEQQPDVFQELNTLYAEQGVVFDIAGMVEEETHTVIFGIGLQCAGLEQPVFLSIDELERLTQAAREQMAQHISHSLKRNPN